MKAGVRTAGGSDPVEVAIIGAGIVGLATARALLARGVRSIRVFEAERSVGAHQTSHNSGVLHAGLYYRPGSLRARLCAEGRERIFRYCSEREIPVRRCGKLVVATDEAEHARLDEIRQRGEANGLTELRVLTRREFTEIEPHAGGIAALHVPHTGVVDFAQVARAIRDDVQSAGVEIVTDGALLEADQEQTAWRLRTPQGVTRARFVIGCAGLQSDRVARMFGVDPPVRILPFRGAYWALHSQRADLVRALIYPVPDPRFPFLGVHLTRTISGPVEIGPNAIFTWSRHGYRRGAFRPSDAIDALTFEGFWELAARHWRVGAAELRRAFARRAFLREARKLLPGLGDRDVRRSRSGVRAQAVDREGRLVDDFLIADADRSIHVLNAPSPAATASLAIGEEIARRAEALSP